LIPALAE
jgi:hypothetical protein